MKKNRGGTRWLRWATTMVVLCTLTGCGYRLAGTIDPAGLQGTAVADVTAGQRSSETAYAIEEVLRQSGALATTGQQATQTLRIHDDALTRRNLTVTAGARSAEYELVGEVEFELVNANGEVIIPRRRISADAIYLRERTNVTGSIEEERLLRREIRQELARRILTAVRVTAGGAPAAQGG